MANILYRTSSSPTVPVSTTVKTIPLTNLEIDGNFKSIDNDLATKAPINNPTFTGTVNGITKTMVGLPNVDNVSDANKPISTATQTALNAKQATLVSGTNIKSVNGQSLVGSSNLDIVIYLDYTTRANLRTTSANAFSLAVVRGLGIFSFVTASVQADDDETAFAATGGVWEMIATDPDYNYAVHSDAINSLEINFGENIAAAVAQAIPYSITRGTFSMSATTLAAETSTNFTCSVSGVVVGDDVFATPGNSFGGTTDQLNHVSYVSSPGTVTVSIRNAAATTANFTASTWSVTAIKPA